MKHHSLLFACSTLCILVACTKQTTSSPATETTALQTTASTVLTTTTSESTTAVLTTQTPESTIVLETTVEEKPAIERMSDEVVAINREKYAPAFADLEVYTNDEETLRHSHYHMHGDYLFGPGDLPLNLHKYRYTFFDLNEDGQQELFISSQPESEIQLDFVYYTRMERGEERVKLLTQSANIPTSGFKRELSIWSNHFIHLRERHSRENQWEYSELSLEKYTNEIIFYR